jgi:hypothetical protein
VRVKKIGKKILMIPSKIKPVNHGSKVSMKRLEKGLKIPLEKD